MLIRCLLGAYQVLIRETADPDRTQGIARWALRGGSIPSTLRSGGAHSEEHRKGTRVLLQLAGDCEKLSFAYQVRRKYGRSTAEARMMSEGTI